MALNAESCIMQGQLVPAECLGELREADPRKDDLAVLMEEDGYVFVRQAIQEEWIAEARQAVFRRLAEVDEIAEPAIDGIATGRSRRKELHPDLGTFWQTTSELPSLRKVSHGGAAEAVISAILGEAAKPHDYMFLRPAVPGRATDLHYDYPFFARGSQRVVTAWTALGPIPVTDGPLVVVEQSHTFMDLIAPVKNIDYDSKESPRVQLSTNPIAFAVERKSRLLTADFDAGDLIVFGMTTMHGTLDNHSSCGRTRLSCDVRWQPAAEPFDERYMGDSPAGTTGVGYGELNGAKPLTQSWHAR